MSLDRAQELARLDDVWPEVAKHLDGFAFTDGELEAKFRRGEAEHGRDWLRMTKEDLEVAIQEELMDMVIYRAMILARWPDQSTSWNQHRPADDGDEDVSGVPV